VNRCFQVLPEQELPAAAVNARLFACFREKYQINATLLPTMKTNLEPLVMLADLESASF